MIKSEQTTTQLSYNNIIGNVKIFDLIYIPVGNYNEMFSRPYKSNMNVEAIEKMINRMNERNTKIIDHAIMSGITSDIIAPSVDPLYTSIDKNWIGQKKYIFLLTVLIDDTFGIQTKCYFQGYTNYDGISYNGYADPKLMHYINNVIETHVSNVNTPFGVIPMERLKTVYNVINYNNPNNYMFLQRPYDIYSNIETLNTAQYMHNDVNFNSIVDTRFTMGGFDNSPRGSNIINNIPLQYVTSVLNAGIKSASESSMQISINEYSPNYFSMADLSEPNITNNDFMKYLRMHGNQDMKSFSFMDLLTIDSTIADRFKLINITKNDYYDYNNNSPDVGEYWHGRDVVTISAYMAIESSLSIALKYGFSKINFTVSNKYTITAEPYCVITNFQSYITNISQADIEQLLEIFKTRIITDCFIDLTKGNKIPCTINVIVDLLGTTKINMEYLDAPPTWYTIPTFASSSFLPVATYDKKDLDDLSQNVMSLVDNII